MVAPVILAAIAAIAGSTATAASVPPPSTAAGQRACLVRWQKQHPDQWAAERSLVGKGWTVSGNPCTSLWIVSNPLAGSAIVYWGRGAGLPAFDARRGDAPATPGPITDPGKIQ